MNQIAPAGAADTTHASEIAPRRMTAENPNLDIWLRNEPTDVYVSEDGDRKTLKPIEGRGYKGSSVNGTYVVKRLTAEFGPVGIGWAPEPVSEEWKQGGPIIKNGEVVGHEIVHILKIKFWYVAQDGRRGEFYQFGQTAFVSKNGHTDEEAPKKSLTDALTKSASWLGVAADIHLGLWDDNKYTERRFELEEEIRAEARREAQLSLPYNYINSKGDLFRAKNAAAWVEEWLSRAKQIAGINKDNLRQAWATNAEAIASTRLADEAAVEQVEKAVKALLDGKPQDKAEPDPKPAAAAQSDSPPPNADGPPEPTRDAIPFYHPDGKLYTAQTNGNGPAPRHWLLWWNRALVAFTKKDAETLASLNAWAEKNAAYRAFLTNEFPEFDKEAGAALEKARGRISGFPGDQATGGK